MKYIIKYKVLWRLYKDKKIKQLPEKAKNYIYEVLKLNISIVTGFHLNTLNSVWKT